MPPQPSTYLRDYAPTTLTYLRDYAPQLSTYLRDYATTTLHIPLRLCPLQPSKYLNTCGWGNQGHQQILSYGSQTLWS